MGYLCAATSEGRPRRGIDSLLLSHSSASSTVGFKLSPLSSASSACFPLHQFTFHPPCHNKSRLPPYHSASSLSPRPVVGSPITSHSHLFLFSSTLAHFIHAVSCHVSPFLSMLISPDNEAAEQNVQCDGTFRHNCRLCFRSVRTVLIIQSLKRYRNKCWSVYAETKCSGVL